MDIRGFIQEYFIDYLWHHRGYNIYNTLTFALVALFFIWLFYYLMKKYEVKIDKNLVLSIIPFVLLGSTLRVITDSLDTGVMQQYVLINQNIFSKVYEFIIASNALDYGYFTVTPGIYFVIAGIFFSSLFICHRFKKIEYLKYIGIILVFPFLILLLPMVRYLYYPAMIISLTISAVVVCFFIFKRFKIEEFMLIMVGAHAIDGASTFVSIDIFNKLEYVCTEFGRCYNEQHVIPAILGTQSFFIFFLIKIIIIVIASYVLTKEKLTANEKYYLILVLMVMGLAPGMRNLMRVMIGA